MQNEYEREHIMIKKIYQHFIYNYIEVVFRHESCVVFYLLYLFYLITRRSIEYYISCSYETVAEYRINQFCKTPCVQHYSIIYRHIIVVKGQSLIKYGPEMCTIKRQRVIYCYQKYCNVGSTVTGSIVQYIIFVQMNFQQ